MSKICTDLEQSYKLISLGLNKNTADMHYFSDGYNPTKLDVGYSAEDAKFYRGTENKYIPAWSLTALLDLIPHDGMHGIELNNYNDGKTIWTALFNHKSELYTIIRPKDNAVDAVFEIVVWLLENGYIKKVKK